MGAFPLFSILFRPKVLFFGLSQCHAVLCSAKPFRGQLSHRKSTSVSFIFPKKNKTVSN